MRRCSQTAAQLFLEKSYTRTSLNDVAERLDITKPALYHYFQNKEEVLLDCYRLGSRMIEVILNEIAAHCGTGLEKVEGFIRSYADVMTVNFGRCVMRLDEGDLSRRRVRRGPAYKRKIDRRLRGFIQDGIADGSILACDPKIAAFTIAGALNWICIWYEPRGGALTPEQIWRRIRTNTDPRPRGASHGRWARSGSTTPRRRTGNGTRTYSKERLVMTAEPAPHGSRLCSIRKAAVLGAGTMGARIAAHLANAGVDVVLLDLASDGPARSAIAATALEALKKSKPAAFYDASLAARITPGNFDDDLPRLADCDWIIEAVTENLEIKQALLDQVAPARQARRHPHHQHQRPAHRGRRGQACPPALRRRWFGTHFFNPPRYMRLVEIIPTPETDPAVIAALAAFRGPASGQGRGLRARHAQLHRQPHRRRSSCSEAIRLMQSEDLTIEEVDALTGPAIGWPRTGTFRLADLVGLDVMAHVAANFAAGCAPAPRRR